MPEARAVQDTLSHDAAISDGNHDGEWRLAMNFFSSMPEAKAVQDMSLYSTAAKPVKKAVCGN